MIEEDASKAEEILNHFNSVDTSIESTTIPFDWSIMNEAGKWNNVVQGLQEIGDDMVDVAVELGAGTFEI